MIRFATGTSTGFSTKSFTFSREGEEQARLTLFVHGRQSSRDGNQQLEKAVVVLALLHDICESAIVVNLRCTAAVHALLIHLIC